MATRIIVSILFTLSATRYGLADETLSQRIDLIDAEYQQLAEEIFSGEIDRQNKVDTMEALVSNYHTGLSLNNRAKANRLLIANRQLFVENPQHPLLIDLVETLLADNERQLAETIYGLIETSGDDTNLPYLDYAFAKFYATHRQWQQVVSILETIPIELSGEDADYAYLLQGIARQYLKQHRLSVQSYDNIADTSPFYLHARLNTALANLRQGWTTEARVIMTDLAPVSRNRHQSEFTNRIYLVLGYALLQKEFFRDARDAFRHVDSESGYSSRALFGIALSAVSQRDYSGGLNAVKLLKAQDTRHISRDEAFLLAPYIHERLGRKQDVEDGFSEAIDHFEQRLQELRLARSQPVGADRLILDNTGKLDIGKVKLDFSRHYPEFLLTNRRNLGQLAENLRTKAIFPRVDSLLNRYDALINEVVAALIDRQIGFLNSYLNQARYGLARHIDNQAGNLQ